MPGRCDFGEVGGAGRDIHADADTDQEADGEQLPQRIDESGEDREDDEEDQIGDEDGATAEPIGQVAEDQQSDHGAEKSGRSKRSDLRRGEVKRRPEEDQRGADHQEIVAVDELAEGHEDRGVALAGRHGLLIQRVERGAGIGSHRLPRACSGAKLHHRGESGPEARPVRVGESGS